MPYLVLIADLVASRRTRDRQALQHRLKTELAALNERKPGLTSPYTLTLGDEFQAVFGRADRVFADLVGLLGVLHPTRIRFSLGLGAITTDLNPDQALGMDGPAFYAARDGIGHLKSSGDLMRIEGLPTEDATLANGSLRLISQRMDKWHANRFAILHGLMSECSVQAIAERIDISEQAVYKNIHSGGLDAVIEVLSALTERLNRQLADRD
ncbi:SatD family protein [Saccharospirillum salsuginis]|uniref:DNA-binding protein n=1 Tax=Saccharospirillum salsuginis TaxID=418750 RepID=A0A918KL52_9GAMM|nr:SatD family protein [Saccharospirillum salsuginis]GGX65031.1 DNA-binding protein [Saccharospirillum salsuginis]